MTRTDPLQTIVEMRDLLEDRGIRNWQAGLSLVEERVLDDDLPGASRTYAGMQGNGGFSDMYFPDDASSTARLDGLRKALWKSLNE